MAVIPDMHPCEFLPFDQIDNTRAVGWIGPGIEFATGGVTETFFRKLCELIQDPWTPTASMGIHGCELCQFSEGGRAYFDGMTVPGQSNREVYVPHDGVLLVAPILIAHYIDAHVYKPPKEFVDAVLECPPMRSMQYHKALLANGGRELLRGMQSG